MSTEKTRKNPDYTGSAVNLTNSPEMANLLCKLAFMEGKLAELKQEADNYVPMELKERIITAEQFIVDCNMDIRQQIDEHGSFQSPETGAYAVKQKKQSWDYCALPFLQAPEDSLYGKTKDMVLEQVVNVQALNGLIKGGILHEQNLKDEGVIVPGKVTYTYIIKAGDHANGA